jgi:hypothetical protein
VSSQTSLHADFRLQRGRRPSWDKLILAILCILLAFGAARPAVAAPVPAEPVTPIYLLGIPVDFILFGLTLLGVALFHHHTLQVALPGWPTSFRSPWQNGLVERLIGSARHECTDHVIVFNEEHLRRILSKYASYYNEVRTHLSLGKDAPCTRPIERVGDIIAQPILGGLHHRYARI